MGRILQAAQVISAGSASLRTVFRSHMATALLSMARDGRGVCWAPLSVAAADLESGRLVAAGDARWHVPIEIRNYKPIARRSASLETFWAKHNNREDAQTALPRGAKAGGQQHTNSKVSD